MFLGILSRCVLEVSDEMLYVTGILRYKKHHAWHSEMEYQIGVSHVALPESLCASRPCSESNAAVSRESPSFPHPSCILSDMLR